MSGDVFCVHIRCCGHGHLGFRPYGGLLGKAPSNQGLLPLTFGASPRLGIPSLRSCSVGPPRSAIHGRTRLTRHPCRVAHCAEPPLGLSRGQEDQKPKPKRGGRPAGLTTTERRSPVGASLLAKNARTPRAFRQPASSLTSIASKLAPTEERRAEQKQIGVHPRFSPLNRPSVSSPAALDLDPPAPSAG